MKIQFLGHACFKVVSGEFAVILDPYSEGSVPGLRDLEEIANLCLCSHGHGDHHGVDRITVIEGENPFSVKKLDSWHDDKKGTLRGANIIHILEADGVKAVHMGDIGCMPQSEQLAAVRGADVLMIPVGGHYTAAPEVICDMIRQINPKVIIPMHYRNEKSGFDVIGTCEEFVELAKQKLNLEVEWMQADCLETGSGKTEAADGIVVLQQNKWK